MALNLSLISNKAPSLCSVICSEINTASITNIRQLYFIGKRFYNLLHKHVSGLLCLLLCHKLRGKYKQLLINL